MLEDVEKYVRLLKYLKEDKANGKTTIHLRKIDFPSLRLHTAQVDSIEYKTIKVELPDSTMGGDYIPQEILEKYYTKSWGGYYLNYQKGYESVRLSLDIPMKQYNIEDITQRVKNFIAAYKKICLKYIHNHEIVIRESQEMIEKYQRSVDLINQTE